jgi:hypothetical protein
MKRNHIIAISIGAALAIAGVWFFYKKMYKASDQKKNTSITFVR